MRTAEARAEVPLDPGDALALWSDTARWPGFVEGFGRVESVDRHWPDPGAKAVWESTPGGRGRVTERVTEREAGRLTVQLFEDALAGTQTFAAVPRPDGGSVVQLRLEYELARSGPLREVADWLFIRRALRDALRRTLHRFAVEAEEDAGLR
jgi:Polyketide cyclase / dehydrase and lipid transport